MITETTTISVPAISWADDDYSACDLDVLKDLLDTVIDFHMFHEELYLERIITFEQWHEADLAASAKKSEIRAAMTALRKAMKELKAVAV